MILDRAALECQRHVASSAAQVENSRVFILKNVVEGFGGAPPPQPVDIARKHVVQQVIAWRDGGKHFAHRARGRLLVASAFRRSSGCGRRRWGAFSHWHIYS
jgi:hypothetical protein